MVAMNLATTVGGRPISLAGACEQHDLNHVKPEYDAQRAVIVATIITPIIAAVRVCCWGAPHQGDSGDFFAVMNQLTRYQTESPGLKLELMHVAFGAQSSTWPAGTTNSCDLVLGRPICLSLLIDL